MNKRSKKIAGGSLIATPFVALFVGGWMGIGFFEIVSIFIIMGLIFGAFTLGTHLLCSDD